MKKNNRLLYLIIGILTIWCLILTSFVVRLNKKEDNSENITLTEVSGFSTDLTNVVEQTKASCCIVESSSANQSGFVYGYKDGKAYIVTSAHGLSESYLKVTFASRVSYDATIIGKDDFADVAVLAVDVNFDVPTIKLGNSDLLKDGEFLVVIGTPKSNQYAFSNELAIISSKNRTITNSITANNNHYEYYEDVIQLSSNLKEGYSGAPIINMAGEVEGIIEMKDDTAVFALPINEIKIIADSIINGTKFNKLHFNMKGSFIKDLENYEKAALNIPLDINNGYFVRSVKSLSLASNLGIKANDIIIKINDTSIASNQNLLNISYSDIKEFEIETLRNNETVILKGSIND